MRRALILSLFVCCFTFADDAAVRDAELALARGDHAKAIEILTKEAQSAKEGQDYLYYLVGVAQLAAGRHDDAVASFDRVIKDFPQSAWRAKATFRRADALAAKGDFAGAEKVYEERVASLRAEDRRQALAMIYVNAAREFLSPKKEGEPPDFAKALDLLLKAQDIGALGKESQRVAYEVPFCQHKLGQHDAAVAGFDRLLADSPKSEWAAAASFHRGLSLLQLGRVLDARDAWKKVLADAPKSEWAPKALMETGHSHAKGTNTEDVVRAVAAYRQVVKDYPKDDLAPQALGSIAKTYLSIRGMTKEAYDAVEELLKAYPASPAAAEALQAKANDLLGEQKYDEALTEFDRFLKAFPQSAKFSEVTKQGIDTRYAKAYRAHLDKRYDDARKLFAAFLDAYPLDSRAPRLMFLLGDMSHEEKKLDDAIAAWKKVVEKYPSSDEAAHAQLSIAETLANDQGKFEEALKEYAKVGQGEWQKVAKERIAQIEGKSLALLTERAIPTGGKATVKLTTRNVEGVKFKVYRVDLKDYFLKTVRASGWDALDIALIAPDKEWDVKVDGYAKYKEIAKDVELPFADPGAYVVTATEETLEAKTLVLVSDLAVVLKASQRGASAFVENLKDGSVVEKPSLTVGADGKLMSDPAHFPDDRQIQGLSAFISAANQLAALEANLANVPMAAKPQAKGFLLLDRGTLRPGERVNLWAVLRDAGNVLPAKDKKVVLEATLADGRRYWKQDFFAGDFGTFAGSIAIDKAMPGGPVAVQMKWGDKVLASAAFRVGEFRDEAWTIDFAAPKSVKAGEKVQMTMTLLDAEGRPAAGRKIAWRVNEIDLNNSGVTDEAGQIKVEVDTNRFYRDDFAFVYAQAPSGKWFGKMTKVIDPGYRIAFKDNRDMYVAEEPVVITVTTHGFDDKPRAAKLAFRVINKKEEADKEVAKGEISTDEKEGEGTAKFDAKEGGLYRIEVEGRDARNLPILVATGFRVSAGTEKDESKLHTWTTYPKVKAGEAASIEVHWRGDKALALVSVEADHVIATQTATLNKGTNHIEIKPPSEGNAGAGPRARPLGGLYVPVFHVTTTVIAENKTFQDTVEFAMERELSVKVDPAAPVAHPGDEAKVNVTVTDEAGKPVEANVVLIAYDEEWEPLLGEAGNTLDATFFPRDKQAYVATTSSVPFRYEGGGRVRDAQVIAALATLEAQSRHRNAPVELLPPDAGFEDYLALKGDEMGVGGGGGGGNRYGGRFGGKQNLVARGGGTLASKWSPRDSLPTYCPALVFWNASVTANRQGKAVVTIAVPDRVGHLKLLAISTAKDTSFGRGSATLRVTQAVDISLEAPREMREGDKGTARVVLRTSEKDGKEVDLKFTVRQGGKDETLTEKVKFSGTWVHDYPVNATAPGVGHVQVSLGGQSVRKPLTVSAWAMPVEKASGAEVSAKTTVPVEVPPAKDAENPSLDVFVSRGDIEFLRFVTHGEFTDNGVMADLARLVARVDAKALSARDPKNANLTASLEREIGDEARHMMLLQNPDGGWPWQQGPMRRITPPAQQAANQPANKQSQSQQVQNDQEAEVELPASDLFATGLAFHVLSRIEKAGNKDLTPVLDRAAEWLRRAFSDTEDNDLKACCLTALSARSEATIFAYANRLYRGKDTLSPRALALTAITFAQIGKTAEAKEMLALFTKKAIEKDGLCHWEMPQDEVGALSSPVELTGLGVEAMSLVTPADARVAEGWKWLLSQRTGHGWSSAVETLVCADVSTILAAARADLAVPESVVVSVNGKAIATVGAADGIAWGRVRVPASLLKEGANEVVLEPKGAGRFAYVARLSYGTPGISATSGEVPFELKRTFDPSNLRVEGEEIASGYSVVRGNVTPIDNPVDRVTAQESFGVHLALKVKDAKLRYFLVEEPIPAGCAVVAGSVSGGFTGYAVQRDRIVFRVRRADEEEFEFSYRLYALHGGAYRVPPARIVGGGRDVRLGGRKDAFAVLPAGKDSREGVKSTPDELYALGKRAYDKKDFARALAPLAELLAHWKLQDAAYTDVSRMLLYIYLDKKDSENVVRFFEVMKEKDPAVVIPFDDIVRIGGAYREMKELERGMQVFRGTADAYFLQEANIAGSLEALGRSRTSVEFMKKLALSYPDTETTRMTIYSLGGDLFRRAKATAEGPKSADAEKYTRAELLDESVRLLRASLRENPSAKTGDEMVFTLGNAYLEQEAYEAAEAWSRLGWDRFKESRFHHSFEYMEAYALFALKRYDDALKTIDTILAANNPGPSEYAPQARHMMGQIFHAMGNVEKAIAAYREVKASFPDAARAIDYLEKQALSLPEVTTLGVKEKHEVEIESRGVGEVTLKAYKVDLMMLYLKQRNLNDVTKVNLAGVKPVWEKTVKLQDGSHFKKETTKVEVGVEGPGAFLLIARSGDISSAGMLLSTDLTLDVQEDASSGVVRTNVVGKTDGKFVENAKVSGLGSKDPSFFHARTDLRGVAELTGLHGFPTVIVEKDGNYGFYRGHADLAMAEAQGQQERNVEEWRAQFEQKKQGGQNKEALEQLEKNLQGLNDQQNAYWNENSRKAQKGVEVERTK